MRFDNRMRILREFSTSFAASAALFAQFLFASLALAAGKGPQEYLVYVGTYTGPKSKGIYAYRFQPSTGKISPIGLVAETRNPSFLALHPNGRYLYAVNEVNDYQGQRAGSVSSFAIDPKTGKLTLLNQVSSRGAGPCHLVVDKSGKNVLVANYNSGSVAVLPVRADGSLGEAAAFVQHQGSSVNPRRQQGPHAHCVALSPDNRFALVADLGLDEVLIYRFDAAKGLLTPNSPPFAKVSPGSGPRHLWFHPNGEFLYVNNEMANTITVFAYQAGAGSLTAIQTVPTLPSGFSGESTTAEIETDRAGKFLYVSNRGHDSIAEFAVDGARGTLTLLGHAPTQGKSPRNFQFDPTGSYVFVGHQSSDNTVLFRVNPQTGILTAAGETLTDAGSPVCIVFLAAR